MLSDIKNLSQTEAIKKLKSLVEMHICLFCTNLNKDHGATYVPMRAQKVCDKGNIWFFSDKNSEKNKEIDQFNNVQLLFSHQGKGSYIIVNGIAEIISNQAKTKALWNHLIRIWFNELRDDRNISIIKVKPTFVYYWGMDENKMINYFKMLASPVIGPNPVIAEEGSICY